MENKAYTMRPLKGDDLFLVVRIINKIGFKEIKKCFASEDVKNAISNMVKNGDADNADLSSVGMSVVFELVSVIMEHLPDCKTDIYQLLETLSGMSAKEVAELPMLTFVDMVTDVIKAKEFTDFFQRLIGSSN